MFISKDMLFNKNKFPYPTMFSSKSSSSSGMTSSSVSGSIPLVSSLSPSFVSQVPFTQPCSLPSTSSPNNQPVHSPTLNNDQLDQPVASQTNDQPAPSQNSDQPATSQSNNQSAPSENSNPPQPLPS